MSQLIEKKAYKDKVLSVVPKVDPNTGLHKQITYQNGIASGRTAALFYVEFETYGKTEFLCFDYGNKVDDTFQQSHFEKGYVCGFYVHYLRGSNCPEILPFDVDARCLPAAYSFFETPDVQNQADGQVPFSNSEKPNTQSFGSVPEFNYNDLNASGKLAIFTMSFAKDIVLKEKELKIQILTSYNEAKPEDAQLSKDELNRIVFLADSYTKSFGKRISGK